MVMHLLEGLEDAPPLREVILGSPLRSAAIAGAVVLGGGALLVAGVKRVTSKKTRKKRRTATTTRRKTTRKRKSVVPRKGKRWYGKTKTRTIKHTKNGQPYVILASGKARFIKKSRASSMKKRKGGYR